LDCSGEKLKVLREGPISLAAIHKVINETD